MPDFDNFARESAQQYAPYGAAKMANQAAQVGIEGFNAATNRLTGAATAGLTNAQTREVAPNAASDRRYKASLGGQADASAGYIRGQAVEQENNNKGPYVPKPLGMTPPSAAAGGYTGGLGGGFDFRAPSTLSSELHLSTQPLSGPQASAGTATAAAVAAGTAARAPLPHYVPGPYDIPEAFAHGTTRVPGKGDGKTDKVHAMLAPGEAVLNKAAAEKMGRGKIAKANAEGVKKMGMGKGMPPGAKRPMPKNAMGGYGDSGGLPTMGGGMPGFAGGTSNVPADPNPIQMVQTGNVLRPVPAYARVGAGSSGYDVKGGSATPHNAGGDGSTNDYYGVRGYAEGTSDVQPYTGAHTIPGGIGMYVAPGVTPDTAMELAKSQPAGNARVGIPLAMAAGDMHYMADAAARDARAAAASRAVSGRGMPGYKRGTSNVQPVDISPSARTQQMMQQMQASDPNAPQGFAMGTSNVQPRPVTTLTAEAGMGYPEFVSPIGYGAP